MDDPIGEQIGARMPPRRRKARRSSSSRPTVAPPPAPPPAAPPEPMPVTLLLRTRHYINGVSYGPGAVTLTPEAQFEGTFRCQKCGVTFSSGLASLPVMCRWCIPRVACEEIGPRRQTATPAQHLAAILAILREGEGNVADTEARLLERRAAIIRPAGNGINVRAIPVPYDAFDVALGQQEVPLALLPARHG